MDRSLRPPLVVYSTNKSGCSLMALLAALTSALFLQAYGVLRSAWWVSLGLSYIALSLLLRRRAVVIDPERRQVTLIERWFSPVTTRKTVWIERISVRLELPPRTSDSFTSTVWLDDGGSPAFRFAEYPNAEEGREAARRLAADLERPFAVRQS